MFIRFPRYRDSNDTANLDIVEDIMLTVQWNEIKKFHYFCNSLFTKFILSIMFSKLKLYNSGMTENQGGGEECN